jgi:tRNA pseudouridine13 synthase
VFCVPADGRLRHTPSMDVPFLTSELPGTGGRMRAVPEDFRVEEVPLYPALGVGDHVHLTIEKRDITTYEAVRRVARALRVSPKLVGFAGLKDAHAVAVQTLSVEHVTVAAAEAALAGVPNLRLSAAKLHRNKIQLGHLRGNRFAIRVRDVAADAIGRAHPILERLVRDGCPNLYGEQRFGNRADNDRVGRLLVRGDFRGACELAGDDLRRKPRSLVRLFVSAYQSALFNRLVIARMPHLGRLETGDLAYLHDRGAVFRVLDAATEQPRADRFEISPSAPLFGTKVIVAEGRPGESERALLEEEGLTRSMFRVDGVGVFPGERRPMRIPVADASVLPLPDDPHAIELRFELPRGSYATVVLREVMKTDGLSPRRH